MPWFITFFPPFLSSLQLRLPWGAFLTLQKSHWGADLLKPWWPTSPLHLTPLYCHSPRERLLLCWCTSPGTAGCLDEPAAAHGQRCFNLNLNPQMLCLCACFFLELHSGRVFSWIKKITGLVFICAALWWISCFSLSQGWFPASYVELLDDLPKSNSYR